jgi:polyisoprenoid-binding protein YceI
MKRRLIPLTSLALAAAATAVSAHAASVRTLSKGSQITIDGQSSVRAFTCKARAVRAESDNEPAAALPLPERIKLLVAGGELEIAAKALDCGDPAMNQHMYDALKAQENPQIRFRIAGVELGAIAGDSIPVKFKGELTLSGRTLPISLSATATSTNSGGVRLQGSHLLRMTDWGVNPPSLFFGTLKVRDSVVVRFDVAAEDPSSTVAGR